MSATILVIEDEAAIAELIRVNLTHAGYEVQVCASAEQAQTKIASALPDAILLDWMLPGQSGIQLARQLRQHPRTRDLPLILLTARAAEQDKIDGLETGADDYITKPFSPKELMARLKAVLRRRAPQHAMQVVEIDGLCIDPMARRVYGDGQEIEIGPTEYRLLLFFMTHPERVHSRGQLLDQVWGDHVFVEERTIDVHIRRLRQTLAVTGHDRLIETVRGAGYRLASSNPP